MFKIIATCRSAGHEGDHEQARCTSDRRERDRHLRTLTRSLHLTLWLVWRAPASLARALGRNRRRRRVVLSSHRNRGHRPGDDGQIEGARDSDHRKAARSGEDPRRTARFWREKLDVDEQTVLRWANLADRMRIKGVREPYAELLKDRRRRYRPGTEIPQSRPARRGDGATPMPSTSACNCCRRRSASGTGSRPPRSCRPKINY